MKKTAAFKLGYSIIQRREFIVKKVNSLLCLSTAPQRHIRAWV
jgi:regulator of RNase E activity RraB